MDYHAPAVTPSPETPINDDRSRAPAGAHQVGQHDARHPLTLLHRSRPLGPRPPVQTLFGIEHAMTSARADAPDVDVSDDVAGFEAARAAVADVEGWMTPGQARLLWDCASAVAPGGRIVEIGSFRGRSTIVLARAAADDVEVIAIDPHAGNDRGPQEIEGFEQHAAEDHEVFLANLEHAGVAGGVRHLRRFSSEALDDVAGEIHLLYIDGAHRFGPARDDIRRWGAKVATGGTLLIHDSFSSVGVTAAMAAELFAGPEFRYLGRSESMTRYRRERLSGGQRLRNAARQVAELPWFARNVVIKAMIVARLGRLTRPLFGHDPETWPY